MESKGHREVEPSDAALACRVQRGDRDAFEILARRYLRPVYAVAASFLTNPADREDAVQDAFLRLVDGIQQYDGAQPFAPWLYQIARNAARNRRASGSPEMVEYSEADEVADPVPDPALHTERVDARELIDRAIGRLPEQQRTMFRLFEVEGYTAVEIEQLTGVSAVTVRSHVYHARRRLRAALEAKLGQETE
ncbi:MAG: sigma-70 family RNA polymerase sigma factor [Gemmatimonadetes bacterium]|nr:sigma-70 family RNA polymerase sigma factor [Gemmatimonadota bacterium]